MSKIILTGATGFIGTNFLIYLMQKTEYEILCLGNSRGLQVKEEYFHELLLTIQKNKSVQHNGKLILVDGSKKFLCNPTYIITPKVGDFYLFPSYMMHTVYPFSNTLDERRSVSFNAKIDDDSSALR